MSYKQNIHNDSEYNNQPVPRRSIPGVQEQEQEQEFISLRDLELVHTYNNWAHSP